MSNFYCAGASGSTQGGRSSVTGKWRQARRSAAVLSRSGDVHTSALFSKRRDLPMQSAAAEDSRAPASTVAKL